MKGLFTELIQPIDDDTNIFTSIKTVGDKVDTAADIILGIQEGVDTFKEKNLDIPAGGDILLFGIEGTATLRETLEAELEVSKADFFDFYLKSRLGYAGAMEYGESVKDLKGEYATDLSVFGLSDLLDISESIVATTRVSEEYALALAGLDETSIPEKRASGEPSNAPSV